MSNQNASPAAIPPVDPVMPSTSPEAPVELDASRKGLQAYLPPGASDWAPLNEEAFNVLKDAEPLDLAKIVSNRTAMSDMLAAALRIPNLRIPRALGHPFHGHLDTDSTSTWTVISH